MKSFMIGTAVWVNLLLVANSAFAQGQGLNNREWSMSNWGWGQMVSGGVMMVVFWGGIILLVVLLARGLGGRDYRKKASPTRQSPIEILQVRFAKGEIDQKEYDDRRRVLSAPR